MRRRTAYRRVLRRRISRKYEAAFRVSGGMEALQNAAVVSAEAPIVLGVVPGNGVGKRVRLIELAARRRAIQAAKRDRKSTRLNSSHGYISYAVFCLKKKKT